MNIYETDDGQDTEDLNLFSDSLTQEQKLDFFMDYLETDEWILPV